MSSDTDTTPRKQNPSCTIITAAFITMCATFNAHTAAEPPLLVDAELANGKHRYGKLCVTCHGELGVGKKDRAPQLQSRPELSEAKIRLRIMEGKHGDKAMPPWGEVLDAQSIDQLIAYVTFLAGHDAEEINRPLTPFSLEDPERIASGKKRFNKICAGYCHGFEGVGGRAPDFKGRSDLDIRTIYETIYHGREGADVMPPWGDALSTKSIWELVAYLRYLGNQ
ncbi:MAG: c-type cytochrome [Candidatus Thiodiazotropha sp.]